MEGGQIVGQHVDQALRCQRRPPSDLLLVEEDHLYLEAALGLARRLGALLHAPEHLLQGLLPLLYPLLIQGEVVGHLLGEFALNRPKGGLPAGPVADLLFQVPRVHGHSHHYLNPLYFLPSASSPRRTSRARSATCRRASATLALQVLAVLGRLEELDQQLTFERVLRRAFLPAHEGRPLRVLGRFLFDAGLVDLQGPHPGLQLLALGLEPVAVLLPGLTPRLAQVDPSGGPRLVAQVGDHLQPRPAHHQPSRKIAVHPHLLSRLQDRRPRVLEH